MRRCLVIDDDPIAATFLVDLISAHGWNVDQARSLAQAEACLALHGYDCLLADRRLPDGDGVQWLRGRTQTATWPVSMRCLVTSGDALTADELPQGVAQLRKPIDVDQLFEWLTGDREQPTGAAASVPSGASWSETPLLDDSAALKKFGGRSEALTALRTMLRDELIAGAQWRAQLDLRPPPAAVLEPLHRLRAACALTGCPRLGELSATLESTLRAGQGAEAVLLQAFQRCVHETLEHLAGHARP